MEAINSPGDFANRPLHERPTDYCRPIKVICIGAGISGLLTAIRFPQHIQNLDLVVYEKNTGLGGTWFENRYPGISCDIPAHAYQFTFENNPSWSRFYAPGSEILAYLERVADKYGAKQFMRFEHQFKGAHWNQATGKWHVQVLRLADNEILHDTADVLIKATGILNSWKWPDIPGLADFEGPVIHSARWDESFKPQEKALAVIGNGSTGIQIVPALQPEAKHIDLYVRSKSWVSPQGPFGKQVTERGGNENFAHSEEEKNQFSKDPKALLDFRKSIEEIINNAYPRIFKDSKQRIESTEKLEALVQEKLASKPGLFELLRPEWPVGCKRLGASPGYLEALTETNVEVVTSGIQKIVPGGILDKDNNVRPADAIICATGFDTSLRMVATPILGQNGVSLDEVWDPEPQAYLSMMPAQMPNLFLYLGPNGSPNSTMMVMIEFQCDYMIKCIQKLQREYIKSMVPKSDALADFIRYTDNFFNKTVLTDRCGSWFKSGGREDGRITAMWPGSLPHAYKAYEHPRWEDFDYERMSGTQDNGFAWLGNGLVCAQLSGSETTSYLNNAVRPPVDPAYIDKV